MDNKSNKMLIDATHPEETRVVVLRNGRVEEFDFESATRRPLRGNIYLAKVTRVEPSLQAAFVEYGGNRHGFLAFAEIHPDYYQIPFADRQALLDEEVAAELEADQEADERAERMANRGRRPERHDGPAPGDGDQPVVDMPAVDAVTEPSIDQPHAEAHADATYETRSDATGLTSETLSAEPAEAAPEHAHHHDHASANADDASQSGPHGEGAHDEAAHGVASQHLEASDHADDHAQANSEGNGDGESHIEEVPANTEEPETIDGNNGEQPHANDQSEEMQERPRRQRRRVYKIQEVIKRRQIMLVQVVKEERGTKGAALTTYLSLAGRYTVLMPNTGRGGGISRKITQPQDRKRLKAIAQDLDVPEGMGLIIRTAGAARTMQEIRRDYEYLMRLWESVREMTLSSTAPTLVYEEGSLIKRSIRDQYTKDVDEIVVAGLDAHREAQDFMRMLMPSHAKNVILHDRPEPLFARYPIVDRQLNALFSPHVPLKSGGYLVINQTEALVAIDINSGKSTREFNIEDTALNTNLEASDEIARQVKLRDLAGLIVIDYIDMEEKRNNRSVERRLKDALRFDRARIQVGRISHFGLLEMSRQRMRTGVLEGSTSKCPHCEGTGIVRSVESVSLAVLRGLEEHLQRDGRSSVNVLAQADVALYILNHKRPFIAEMERRYGVFVAVLSSEKLQGANFAVERSAIPVPVRRQPERAAVTMHSALEGQDFPEETFEEGDDPRPASPVVESDIESIDTEEGFEDDRRDTRGRGNNRDRDRGPRRDRGDRNGADRGDRGGDRDRGEPRDDAPRDAQPREGQRSDEGRGDDGRGGGRRRGRGRGRGRDRDERGSWRDRQGQRPLGEGPQPGPGGEVTADRDAAGDAFEFSDDAGGPLEAAALLPRRSPDDAPELMNGDGVEADGSEPIATEGQDGGTEDGEGRRRRRRGRRGGRKGGRERDEVVATGETDPSAAEHERGAVDLADAPGVMEADDVGAQPAKASHSVVETVVVETAPHIEHHAETAEAPEPQAEVAVIAPRPIASEPVIESDAPARPARRGWWRTRGIG
jgi:ribonuclease E